MPLKYKVLYKIGKHFFLSFTYVHSLFLLRMLAETQFFLFFWPAGKQIESKQV
jgi:hypothetical protein